MAGNGSKKGATLDQGLAALRGIVDELPIDSASIRKHLGKHLAKSSAALHADELLLIVVGPREALLKRAKASGAVDLRTLDRWMVSTEIAVRAIANSLAHHSTPAMTADDVALLDEAGFTTRPFGSLDALTQSRIDFEILARDSLDLAEAARDLRVSTGRLRQRLSSSNRTLFGFKEGRTWRVPRFQFQKRGKLVRGIEKILPQVPGNAHPLAVRRWFTTPHQDLVIGSDDQPIAPIDWLSAGFPPEPVAELAKEI